MTGTTTQIMIDVADLMRGGMAAEARTAALARLSKMGASVVVFAAGCAAGALSFAILGPWCFVVPPLLAIPSLWIEPAPGP